MLKICLRRALRPAAHKFQPGLRLTPGCWMGTHGRNEPREPLNSPKIAKEFIYRLHPKERTCLLRELQSFESMAIAQVFQGLCSEAATCFSLLPETSSGEHPNLVLFTSEGGRREGDFLVEKKVCISFWSDLHLFSLALDGCREHEIQLK
uniref:Transmembrane protein 65-like n=1 Tax=Echeneis naucrates TaxID=173247 RepID=A0A665UK08_ECHNA